MSTDPENTIRQAKDFMQPLSGHLSPEMEKAWNILRNVPVDLSGIFLEDDFVVDGKTLFFKGDAIEDVWRWFEEMEPSFSVGMRINGLY